MKKDEQKNMQITTNSFYSGCFGGSSRMREQKAPLPKICHSYSTMMELGTVIPNVKKIQKIYKSRDTPLELC